MRTLEDLELLPIVSNTLPVLADSPQCKLSSNLTAASLLQQYEACVGNAHNAKLDDTLTNVPVFSPKLSPKYLATRYTLL